MYDREYLYDEIREDPPLKEDLFLNEHPYYDDINFDPWFETRYDGFGNKLYKDKQDDDFYQSFLYDYDS